MFDWLIGLFDGPILNYIFGAIIAFLGWRWAVLKKVIKEVGDVVDTIDTSFADDKLSPEEIAAIIKELKEALDAIKELTGGAPQTK